MIDFESFFKEKMENIMTMAWAEKSEMFDPDNAYPPVMTQAEFRKWLKIGDATVKYFSAFEAEKTEITECDKIYQDGNYTYMYITYDLVLKNGQSYPCISTSMVQKKDNGKYYVMTPSEITDDLSKQAATKYADFMNTQAYKDYTTAYDKFIKKNPGYEEKIAAKLK